MKDRDSRDEMIARVKVAFQQWPSFLDMPEKPERVMQAPVRVSAELDANNQIIPETIQYGQKEYVEALYSICARGLPIGRFGNKIVGVKK
jgi:hypothetical protein